MQAQKLRLPPAPPAPESGYVFFFVRFRGGADLHQGELDQQPLVLTPSVLHIRLIDQLHGPNKEVQRTPRRLVRKLSPQIIRAFDQLGSGGILGDQEVAQVRPQACQEVVRIKAALHDAIAAAGFAIIDRQVFGGRSANPWLLARRKAPGDA